MSVDITNTKERRVSSDSDDPAHITITENVRYVPSGYQRGKWEQVSINLTREELHILANLYLFGKDVEIPKVG